MTTYSSTPALLLALSATLTGVVAPAAQAAPGTSVPGQLFWKSCAQPGGPQVQECAELSVPIDYRDPGGEHIKLAVSRVPSDRPEARRGTLIVIPGGPGSSGVQRLTQKGAALQRELKGAYDVVSFDPRGVGGSTTASCGLAAEDRRLPNLRSWPAADGRIDENVARSRRIAEACHRAGGPVLRSLSTANEVRDIESFRKALGVAKLSAVGNSYGTYVGAVYAQKYPRRTDRWVLDSSGDPNPRRVARGWLANTGQAVEDRFPDFAAWAVHPDRDADGLGLGERAKDIRPGFLKLARSLDREPKQTTTPGVPLTGNLLRQALHVSLYSDAVFPQLARLIRAAQDPTVRPVLSDDLVKPMSDEAAAVTMAVICNDARWPGRVSSYRRAVAADRAAYPLTAGFPRNITPCAFWKDAPADEPTRITDEGPSNILMIQSLRDPSTPHFGGLRMRTALGDRARLVSVDQGGHSVYLGIGNVCGDRAVTAFLTTGERPERDTRCPAKGK
ncbi:alpha/beta hydrolase [Streptomyces albipurpureus]|uniref:Alpha/beta hydrolase n=1 Tax=Streptomyces albipurpureus TaxID=2897419 RepID=A0ABT0UL45_9ACTN|nr:alpha/beta hydrolase [Streptomyces sp. CWNU-1]MCM2388997.1 alpha/beta hydrolase [Streptomyces sp. CWNU-1]